MARSTSPSGQLARLGFAEPERAERLLGDASLAGLLTGPAVDVAQHGLAGALSRAADPDLALLALVRLAEAAARGDRDEQDGRQLMTTLRRTGHERDRLIAVLGGSRALGEHLVRHPEHWRCAADATRPTAEGLRAALVTAVSPHGRGRHPAYDALRIAYRRELLAIAALDLTCADPVAYLPVAAECLSWLAEAALEAALAIAREEVGPGSEDCRLAVIGMGKTGGGELNYVSDVDVIFVAEPRDGVGEERAVAVGTRLATAVMRACAASTAEGTLWPVDAALRPEGKNGPLVRTVASHRAYYERWAKTWEFQALLKAWVSAGDMGVGRAYVDAVKPLVWEAVGRENFVEDVQAMRRRVEGHVPAHEAGRQLKLGPGGLRDVEFSVQLLQLVHGRSDPSLRSATTLEALSALAKGGYVGRQEAATLDEAYRLLRTLEHRVQLFRLRRTHLMPTGEADLRRLGRALSLPGDPAAAVVDRWQSRAREVRRIHERLFYRPLLAAAARLSTSDTSLSPEQARERLAALGFRDPAGAMRHLESLTVGVSRRAAIQRTLLPVMLGWFADEADPDAGLLAFRRVSEALGTIHWYLKMLRDEGTAAERLAHILGRSRYAADLLVRSPESVSILGEADGLVPRTREALVATMRSAAARRTDADQAISAVRTLRRHELLRVAFADLTGGLSLAEVGCALSDLTEATLEVSLDVATREVETREGTALGTDMLVVGMGSLGGQEMGYASDADVMFVHRPTGADEEGAQRRAVLVVQEVRRLLGGTGLDPPLGVDGDLRPEGKSGPLVRSLQSYGAYYQRWALTWEFQALLRVRPVAGHAGLAEDFLRLVSPLRWPKGGLSPVQVRDVRTMKARVEAERLPRGADPTTHLKLGRGGLTDVEWTVQLLQLRRAHAVPALRVTGTMAALDAACAEGLLPPDDCHALRAAWTMSAALRNASVLWRGRPADAVPSDLRDAEGIGRITGRRPGQGPTLAEQHRRVARRARAATVHHFYDSAGSGNVGG